MELQTLIIIFLAFTAYAITPLRHNTLNLRRLFDMKQLTDQHILVKILPSFCFTKEPVSQEELEQLQIEPEILDQEDNQNQFFDTHIFWILMYLLGIGTGAMSVLLYQAIQMLP